MSKIYVLKTFDWDYTSRFEFPQVAFTYHHKTFQGACEHAECLDLTICDCCIDPKTDAVLEAVDLLD